MQSAISVRIDLNAVTLSAWRRCQIALVDRHAQAGLLQTMGQTQTTNSAADHHYMHLSNRRCDGGRRVVTCILTTR